ncbi:alpha-hydroxy-acid oxidizing protein [Alicyclobacillus fastidiosus]|uniref:L-lactate oxidase n=1 Tax=Alicyclobacillus fastidiosus TaxID=392011 RepID=A0ABV5AD01_9BACL|nr:alpha-hydroxy-acid oxidizing protein [Alicyclobacillus fastidiosus]WEH08821.1 alpha-hydroxy-acid oxidizing protein [Alicyclobacillus fastidiosus]
MSQFGFDAQLRIYGESTKGRSSWPWPVSLAGWRQAAREVLGESAWGYLEGGAGLEDTMKANREAFSHYRIRSRMLRDVADRDLSVSMLDMEFPVPLLLAPIGVQAILHRDAELASAKAAADAKIPFILSTVSSVPMEQVAQVMGTSVRWFQLYPGKDRDVVSSFLARAQASGYSAVVVTVDTTMLGWREADLQHAYLPFLHGEGMANFLSDPAFCSRLSQSPRENPQAAIQEFLSIYVNPSFTWKQLAEIRDMTDLPVLVKGITHPDDAARVEAMGLEGVVVSNHGGRQVDGGVAALDALVDVRNVVQPDYLVMMDSGVRCAADVAKAMALGANAVLLGRPYAYALAAGGREGVVELLQQWKAELDLQLALSGHRSLETLNGGYVVRV